MDTKVNTPQQVFVQPQRLFVPLFQRPYVWSQENQWAPLWADLTRIAERSLENPGVAVTPHFLGAVVLQQVFNSNGTLQERVVIDGQQRLTTLQILLDALHIEFDAVGASRPALRVESLVRNSEAFCNGPEDRFKVWPTNRDRPAFNEVMAAESPIDYSALQWSDERLVEAHRYFAEQSREWLQKEGAEKVLDRAEAIEFAARELLQVVVIDLTAEENAQEIFETLNARGAQLTAADLIKNFVFQRLMESGEDVESIYKDFWREFETGFWEKEVGLGRIRRPRSSIFLNHWLTSRTGEEVLARDVFTRFKRFADHDANVKMSDLVQQIHASSVVYRGLIEASLTKTEEIDFLGLFSYRIAALEGESFNPVILWLLDPSQTKLPDDQVRVSLGVIESWLVRRVLVRASAKSHTQIAAEIVSELRESDRTDPAGIISNYFAGQNVVSRYWPDDDEVRAELRVAQAYTRLRQRRVRMVLEAIEDFKRGWIGDKEGLGGQRVLRGKYHIEHVMPRKWQKHWPLSDGVGEAERDRLIHTLGNLTLLSTKLNSKVSNGAWAVKRVGIKDHDVLKLNLEIVSNAPEVWDEATISERTDELIDQILQIWPVPEGHKSGFGVAVVTPGRRVQVADLMGAGLIEAGAVLTARPKAFHDATAVILADGRIEVGGEAFTSPTGAARSISGTTRNGWSFFYVDVASKRTLSSLWHEYVEQMDLEADDAEVDDDDEDEDE